MENFQILSTGNNHSESKFHFDRICIPSLLMLNIFTYITWLPFMQTMQLVSGPFSIILFDNISQQIPKSLEFKF